MGVHPGRRWALQQSRLFLRGRARGWLVPVPGEIPRRWRPRIAAADEGAQGFHWRFSIRANEAGQGGRERRASAKESCPRSFGSGQAVRDLLARWPGGAIVAGAAGGALQGGVGEPDE